MGGLFGLTYSDLRRSVEADCLDLMGQAIRGSATSIVSPLNKRPFFSGPFGVGLWSKQGYVSQVFCRGTAPNHLVLALYGRVSAIDGSDSFGTSEELLDWVLDCYEREGTMGFSKLGGEFVAVLWDGTSAVLHLTTDRFRILPLFYSLCEDRLLFASRLRSVVSALDLADRGLCYEAVVDVVASSVVTTPKTIYEHVKKLPPGHVLTYQHGHASTAPYWDLEYRHPDLRPISLLIEEVKELLHDSIARRVADDVSVGRIGTFLSGGIDSSTVTGLAAQQVSYPLQSFSIGFQEDRFNEIQYARIVAQAFGVKHHEYFVTPQDTVDAIPILLEAFDEPFGNASAVPTYFCAKLAKQDHGVDILYAGDGGDELFAGNERYAMQRLFDYYSGIPVSLRESLVTPLIEGLAGVFPIPFLTKVLKYVRRASIPYPDRLSSYSLFRLIAMDEVFNPDFLRELTTDYDSQHAALSPLFTQAPAHTNLDRQLYIDMKLTISDNDLLKVTCATRAAGVLVRFPFLDERLVDFAASVPASVKMRGRKLRTFFKRAYSDFLPPAVLTKTKQGFGLPIPIWLKTDPKLNEMLHDLLLSSRSLQRGYFSRSTLEGFIRTHQTDETSFYGTVLWNFMMLELWHRHQGL